MSLYIVKFRNIRCNDELRNVFDLTIFEFKNVKKCAFTTRLHCCAIQLHNNHNVLWNYFAKIVKNSKFKICRKCESNLDRHEFKSSKFETSIHETINFIILIIRHSYRISIKYSCAKIQKFVSLNKQNEYILRNLQSN